MSIQEDNLKAIADAIREKDGTTAPIVANDFPDRIRAIEGKSEFAVPLVVALDEGAIVTATKGDQIITAVANSNRRAVLTLDQPGAWNISAQLGDIERGPERLEVLEGYDMSFSFQVSRLPEGYTEVEYISNPNLGFISPVMDDLAPFRDRRFEIQVELLDLDTAGSIFGNQNYYRNTSTQMRSNNNRLYYDSTNKYIQLVFGYSSSSLAAPYVYNIDYLGGVADIVVDFPKKIFKINSTETAIASNSTMSATYLAGAKPVLFGQYMIYYYKLNANSTATSYQKPNAPKNFKLYKFMVYNSTEKDTEDLIMNLVPCIDPNGVAGVYDLVSEKFMSGYQGVLFEAGPAV